MLMQALMPSVACGLSLAVTFIFFGQGSILLIVALSAVLVGLMSFLRFTRLRYAA